MTLTWEKPSDNGGSAILDYVLEKREALRMVWKPVGTPTECRMKVKRLQEGVQYIFRVAARNKVGVGAYQDMTRSVATKPQQTVPSAPGQASVMDIYRDSCQISWTSPISDGGSPILGYHVEQRIASTNAWTRVTTHRTTDTTYHVVGLIENSTYEFRVYAENAIGPSAHSRPSMSVLAKDPWSRPGAPTDVMVSDVTRRSCKLSWTPPLSNGGNEIRHYLVEYKATDAFRWVKVNEGERDPDRFHRITGLREDTEYEFRVSAENKAGFGPCSATTLPIKPKDPIGKLASFLFFLLFKRKLIYLVIIYIYLYISDYIYYKYIYNRLYNIYNHYKNLPKPEK